MSQTNRDRQVDHSALRTNQAFIIGLLILGFVLDAPVLVMFVAAVMLVGTVFPSAGLFKRIYQHLLKPSGLVRSDVKLDNPEPHLFAQAVGGIVLLVAAVLFAAGAGGIAWVLSGVVVALAALNLFAGICVGCLIYYQFNRFGVPGFIHVPLSRKEKSS
jgi:hypothetical protein